jgi:dipeptidase D
MPTPEPSESIEITIKGLLGGHSGMDIHKGLGNANKLMNRLLFAVNEFVHLTSLQGGSLRNAIPRESEAKVAVPSSKKTDFYTIFEQEKNAILEEFASIEPNISITVKGLSEHWPMVMDKEDQTTLLMALYGAPNGVYRMSPAIEDLVETSNNIANVTVANGNIEVLCLTRSSVASSKRDLSKTLQSVFELAGFTVTFSGEYPGWAPNMESPILKVLDSIYTEMNNEKAHVAACHAGLECGILGQYYPEMDMISFGPTIKGAHSPVERASISSTQKFWKFLKAILENIPKKND